MSKIMRATIATVGIVLIGSAVGGFVRIWTRKAIFSASAVATLTFFHPQEDRPPKWNWHAPPEQPPEISTNVTVNWPTSAYTNESFTIQLIATNPEQGQQFLLSGAGLQIDPTTWLPLTRSSNPKQGTAQWTGRGTASGIYHLVINITRTNSYYASSSGKIWRPINYVFASPQAFELKVRPKWTDYAEKCWPPISGFLGAFLTLPGILSYMQQRRQKRDRPAPISDTGV